MQDDEPSSKANLRSHVVWLTVCLVAAGTFAAPAGSAGTVADVEPPVASYASRPPVTEYDSLLVSRTDSRHLFLGTQRGLFQTTDGGRSWKPVGLDGEAVTSLTQIGNTILAGGKNLLASSTDGGRTWRRLHPRGLPDHQIDALAAGSQHSMTVYVVLASGGLYRSTDKTRTFSPLSHQIGPAIRALAVTSRNILVGDVSNGIYLSPNGRDWLHTAEGMVMALAVSGENQKHVLAASFGIARSSDGGRTWKTAMHSRVMFGAVAWAPGHPSLAYAVGDNHSFWRSTDGGVDWTRIAAAHFMRHRYTDFNQVRPIRPPRMK